MFLKDEILNLEPLLLECSLERHDFSTGHGEGVWSMECMVVASTRKVFAEVRSGDGDGDVDCWVSDAGLSV